MNASISAPVAFVEIARDTAEISLHWVGKLSKISSQGNKVVSRYTPVGINSRNGTPLPYLDDHGGCEQSLFIWISFNAFPKTLVSVLCSLGFWFLVLEDETANRCKSTSLIHSLIRHLSFRVKLWTELYIVLVIGMGTYAYFSETYDPCNLSRRNPRVYFYMLNIKWDLLPWKENFFTIGAIDNAMIF